jgi:hypothetical protein
LETQDFLEQLVARILMQRSSDKSFVIYSLIRRFLANQLQGEKVIDGEAFSEGVSFFNHGLFFQKWIYWCQRITEDGQPQC